MWLRILLHPLDAVLGIVLMKVIEFDDANQLFGIVWIGGITCFLQSMCPAFVVGDFQFEQAGIAWTTGQELGVVFVRFFGMTVCTEAFATGIVVVANGTPPPIATALDTEVVVGLACQGALTCPRLQQTLCQGDTGGNVVSLHLAYGNIAVFLDIIFVLFVSGLCLRG